MIDEPKTSLVLGWRELIRLPDWVDDPLPAKLDTGAAGSAIHADDLELMSIGRRRMARFRVGGSAGPELIETRVVGHRFVRSSNGSGERRPVVRTEVELAGQRWPIEITLTDRSNMESPVLLGRAALAGRVMVDSGREHLANPWETR